MRIVPDQDPNEVMNQFSDHASSFGGDGLQVEVVKGAANWHGTLLQDGPIVELVQESYRHVWGMPAQLYRAGGSVPLIGLMQRRLGMPVLDLGFSVGGNAHSADEYLVMDYFARGIAMALHVYYGLAAIARPGRTSPERSPDS
jgi:acetylornithine deacetylase/succinyl-diaminopimelate desuccinylase-like protein